MEMWSKGLGRTELAMDMSRCKIVKDPNSDNLIVYGNIADPVDWEFKITVRPEDFPGTIKLMLSFGVIKHFLKHIVKTLLALVGINNSGGTPEKGLVEKVDLAYQQTMKPAAAKKSRPKLAKVA